MSDQSLQNCCKKPFRATARDAVASSAVLPSVSMDFGNPASFARALDGISYVFLIRPPELADAKRYFLPFLEAAQAAGVRHIVFMSVIGAEKNRSI